MLRIAICDDESLSRNHTLRFIEQWENKPNSCLITSFDNGDDLIKSHTQSPFDIIFLDIVMPILNGIETAKEIRTFDKNVKIVFLTSSSDYAVSSYSVKADNYLLKPIKESLLFTCLDELYEELLDNLEMITIKSSFSIHRVFLKDIEFVEAQNKRVVFYLSGGKTISSANQLYSLEPILSLEKGFFKCHRSYIVNINHIDSFSGKEIRMRSNLLVPLSRSANKEFMDYYFSMVFGKVGGS